MAINQALIRPDPMGAFNESYRTVNTGVMEREKLAMLQQQMQEKAIQQARENKAQDFKLMMGALERGDKLEQNAAANEIQRENLALSRQQMGILGYNALTGRMNAGTSMYQATHPNTPYRADRFYTPIAGLEGGSTEPTLKPGADPSRPALPQSGGGNEWNAAAAFGQNGTNLFPTNLPAEEGTGVLPDAPQYPSAPPLVSSDTPPPQIPPDPGAEGAGGPPGVEFSPSAFPQITQDVGPVPTADPNSAYPSFPPITPPMGGGAAAPAATAQIPQAPVVQQMPVAPAAPAPPVPDQSVPAVPKFKDVIPDKVANDALSLARRGEATLRSEAEEARFRASFIASQIPAASPADKTLAMAEIARLRKIASDKTIDADQLKITTGEDTKKVEVLKARTSALKSLGGLEDRLPEDDRREIISKISDPDNAEGAEILQTMMDYNRIRKRLGLHHDSNGIDTAMGVVEARKVMDSPQALGLEFAASQYLPAKQTLDELNAQVATEGNLSDANKLRLAQALKDEAKYEGDYNKWTAMKGAFDMAVKRDMDTSNRDAAMKATVSGLENIDKTTDRFWNATGQKAPGAAAAAAAPVRQTGGLGLRPAEAAAPVAPPTPQQVRTNQFWDEGKARVTGLINLKQADDWELKNLAEGVGGRFEGPADNRQFVKDIDTIAGQIGAKFSLPEGAGDAKITGRLGTSDPINVRHFISAAAADEINRRAALANAAGGAKPPVPAAAGLPREQEQTVNSIMGRFYPNRK